LAGIAFGRLGMTMTLADGAGIGAVDIGAVTIGIGMTLAEVFFLVVFFEVGILHSCILEPASIRPAVDVMTCKLPREAEREVSRIAIATPVRKFFKENYRARSR